MALNEQEEFELLSLEREKAMQQPSVDRPTERGSMPQYLWDEAKKGFAGSLALPGQAAQALIPQPLRGAAATIGNALPDIIGNRLKPTDYGQQWQSALNVQNIPTPTNEYGKPSKANEYLGKIAQFAGASAIPSVGTIAAAERPLIAALVEGISTLVSATGAVEGKELGGVIGNYIQKRLPGLSEQLGINKERGEKIGEFLLSLAGPGVVAAGGKVLERGTGLYQFGKEEQKNAAKLMMQKEFNDSINAAPQTPVNVAEAEALKRQIPGWEPTLGQQTNAPGIIAIENKVQSTSPATLAKAAERETQNLSAIGNYFENKFPAPDGSVITPVKSRYQQLATRMNNQLDATNEHIAALSNISTADNAIIGNQLRELRDVAQNKAKAVRDYMFDDVYESAQKAGIKADVADVKAFISKTVGDDANAAQVMPATLSALQQAIGKYKPEQNVRILSKEGVPLTPAKEGIEVPFEALHSMYKRSGEDLMRAQMAGDPTKAYLIGQVRDVLKQKINAFEGPEFGEVAGKLRAANEWFATKYAPVYYEGLGGRMPYKNRFGEVTADEDVVRNLIFKKGGQRGMQEFTELFGTDQKAMQLLENGVQDMFAKAVVRDGQIRPSLVETFMRDHPQLDQMPALKARLTNIDRANDLLLERQKTIIEQRKMLDSTELAKIAKVDDPAKLLNQALTDRKTMLALTSQAKTAEEKQILARSIAEAVSKQPNPYEFLMNNAPNLRRELEKLGSGHFDNLLNLAKAAQITERTRAPTHVPLERMQDLGEQTVGTSIKGLLSRAMNVAKGYMSPTYAAFDIGGRYIFKVKTAEAERLMQEAIYDPAAAKSLMEIVHNPNEQKWNSLRNHLFSHGIKVVSVAKTEESEKK